jgi:hypothetical protein
VVFGLLLTIVGSILAYNQGKKRALESEPGYSSASVHM